jgi:hypothetical protein
VGDAHPQHQQQQEQRGGTAERAVAALAVLTFPALQLRHLEVAQVALGAPYLPGFLGFRWVLGGQGGPFSWQAGWQYGSGRVVFAPGRGQRGLACRSAGLAAATAMAATSTASHLQHPTCAACLPPPTGCLLCAAGRCPPIWSCSAGPPLQASTHRPVGRRGRAACTACSAAAVLGGGASQSIRLHTGANRRCLSLGSFSASCGLAHRRRRHRSAPACLVQLLLVDGFGALHPRRCGSASHLGALSGLPTGGAAVCCPQVLLHFCAAHRYRCCICACSQQPVNWLVWPALAFAWSGLELLQGPHSEQLTAPPCPALPCRSPGLACSGGGQEPAARGGPAAEPEAGEGSSSRGTGGSAGCSGRGCGNSGGAAPCRGAQPGGKRKQPQ